MRSILTTFVGVLLALLVYAGIRYAITEMKQNDKDKAVEAVEEDSLARQSDRAKYAAN
jgi:hypothetical protein